jgi:hypothetical protein
VNLRSSESSELPCEPAHEENRSEPSLKTLTDKSFKQISARYGRMIRLDNCNFINVYAQLIYGGSIIHNNTLSCGYYGSGFLDHGSFPMTSNGQGDFIHNLNVVGDGEFAGFRVDHST